MNTKIDVLWWVYSFDELSKEELYEILRLRQEVFVVEQDCKYVDADCLDFSAYHLIAKNNEKEIIGYLRIIPLNKEFAFPSIGRVLVTSENRDMGLGKLLVRKGIEFAFKKFPFEEIHISAQKYLLNFYLDLGFEILGEEYLEDGIPHIKMRIFREKITL